jgi:hypothetical protein
MTLPSLFISTQYSKMSATETIADSQNKWYLTIIKTEYPATETN